MISSIDKAIAAFAVSSAVVLITQHTGLPVSMEWAAYATAALTGILSGFFTWLTPNKAKANP